MATDRRDRPVGYQHLVEVCNLDLPSLRRPGQVASVRATQSAGRTRGVETTLYPHGMWPGDDLIDHLRFALRYEGVQPGVVQALAQHADMRALIAGHARRHGVRPLHRRLAFLHTFLTDEVVPLRVSDDERYVDMAGSRLQFVLDRGDRDRRYRVRNNLLGSSAFCPQVFKTAELLEALRTDDVAGIDPWQGCGEDIRERVADYLYLHETQASWQIEAETPDTRRTREFTDLLRRAGDHDFVSAQGLAELNACILGRTTDVEAPWRTAQTWVGYMDAQWREHITLLGAPPHALAGLMDGLVDCHRRIRADGTGPTVVHGACVGFALVYIHPFDDGNGRAHRFVFHNILAQRAYLPSNLAFPLSAWLLHNRRAYIGSMTRTSEHILDRAQLRWLPDARLEVVNDIAPHFRYLDLTDKAVSLHRFIRATVREEMEPNINFLIKFDDAVHRIDNIVNWPYPQTRLFIKLCVQNQGRLSRRKRELPAFRDVPATMLGQLEACVRDAYGLDPQEAADGAEGGPRVEPDAPEAQPPEGNHKMSSGGGIPPMRRT